MTSVTTSGRSNMLKRLDLPFGCSRKSCETKHYTVPSPYYRKENAIKLTIFQRVCDTTKSVPIYLGNDLVLLSNVLMDSQLPDMFHHRGKVTACLQLSISIVVVPCPCALDPSTPAVIIVGTGVGLKSGILIKGGHSFEVSRTLKHVVLGKTDTVTEGTLAVVCVAWSQQASSVKRRASM
ncbi:hypothetical protein EI94DRAFT_73835 [Lactarius quietus]|nr:hypothetical protein EI94DRAFT_73835 [Lactarius quietus]